MTRNELRCLCGGAAAALAMVAAAGMSQQPGVQPGMIGANADMRITQSADGRTVYLWRVTGSTVEYVSTSRAAVGPRPRAEGEEDRPDRSDDDGTGRDRNRDRSTQPGRGRPPN